MVVVPGRRELRFARVQRPNRRRGQSLVEMALVAPVFLALCFGILDFGRYVYVRGTLEADTREGGRLLTLASNRATDCIAQNYVISSDNAFVNSADWTSVWGDGPPPATTPPPNLGYIYIYPAVAQSLATCSAAGTNLRPSGTVSITITYEFQPWTPFLRSQFGLFPIITTSIQPTEY